MNIKSNSVSITLKKAEVGKKWEDLHEVLVQEEDTRPKDPQSKFMDTLKQAYD
jgi:hypothetical protein